MSAVVYVVVLLSLGICWLLDWSPACYCCISGYRRPIRTKTVGRESAGWVKG